VIKGRHLAQVVLASAAALVVAACGGSPSGGSDTNEGQVAWESPGQQYLQIMGPANQAAQRFNEKASTYTDNTTASEEARDAAPLADAIYTVYNDLLVVDWRSRGLSPRPPARTQQDVKQLVRACGALSTDLRLVGSQASFSIAKSMTRLAQDRARVRATANIVRADLGLSPVGASSF
jgi:hypothetical protein